MTITNAPKDGQNFGELAMKAVSEKLGGRTIQCQLCEESNWELRGRLVVAPAWNVDAGTFQGFAETLEMMPLIVLLCKNCGNVLFLSAVALGLRDFIESNIR